MAGALAGASRWSAPVANRKSPVSAGRPESNFPFRANGKGPLFVAGGATLESENRRPLPIADNTCCVRLTQRAREQVLLAPPASCPMKTSAGSGRGTERGQTKGRRQVNVIVSAGAPLGRLSCRCRCRCRCRSRSIGAGPHHIADKKIARRLAEATQSRSASGRLSYQSAPSGRRELFAHSAAGRSLARSFRPARRCNSPVCVSGGRARLKPAPRER